MNDKPPQPATGTHAPRNGTRPPHKKQPHRVSPNTPRKGHAVSRRPRAADVRRTRSRVLLGLYAVLCVEAIVALLTSPALAIKTMCVRGLDSLPVEEQQATLQTLALPRALNWFRVPLGRLRANASGLPWVQTASVERSYSGTLFVHIAPRQPFLALKIGPAWYEADRDGVPIRPARIAVASRLPRVVMQAARPVQMGVPVGDVALNASLEILQKTTQESSSSILKIAVDQNDNICLNMRDGVQFQLGQAENIPVKIALVNGIYAREPNIGKTLAAVNISCPSAPACTPRVAQALPPTAGPFATPASAAP